MREKESMEDLDKLILTLKETKTIPHLLFYGEPHAGKRKKLHMFLRQIYSPEDFKQYCMKIECATSNGIKMIRDVIKEFAKQQIGTHVYFKSIVLYDAENLTIDAQYSLRRCIEVYSKTTRFFIVTSNRDRLLNPICSRFVHLYVHKSPIVKEPHVFPSSLKKWLKEPDLTQVATKLYSQGVYGDMLLDYFKESDKYCLVKFKYESVCKELKNEVWILHYLLQSFLG
jgi:DNA polymerase III delta prime subunit